MSNEEGKIPSFNLDFNKSINNTSFKLISRMKSKLQVLLSQGSNSSSCCGITVENDVLDRSTVLVTSNSINTTKDKDCIQSCSTKTIEFAYGSVLCNCRGSGVVMGDEDAVTVYTN
jgi:hypothetical protein